VTSLEEVMIRTAAHWGVIAERNPMNRGVWSATPNWAASGSPFAAA